MASTNTATFQFLFAWHSGVLLIAKQRIFVIIEATFICGPDALPVTCHQPSAKH